MGATAIRIAKMIETDLPIKEWKKYYDLEDYDIFEHINIQFDNANKWEWPDIGEVGRNVSNVMFDDETEDGSPQDFLYSAIALAASNGAYKAMAVMLGLDERLLESVNAYWYEKIRTDSISFDEFMLLYNLEKENQK
jgi:hypothetical protein